MTLNKLVMLGVFLAGSNYFFAQYSGGSGTTANPYLISTAQDLIDLSETVADFDKHFLQTNDINMSITSSLNGGLGFKPIGDFMAPTCFVGTYDGGNYKIIDLYIDRPNQIGVGLFGYFGNAGNGAIRNVNIEASNSVYINGQSRVGGLVGMAQSGVIENCSVGYSQITGDSDLGGLVGRMSLTLVTNCRVIVSSIYSFSTTQAMNIGGLVGAAHDAQIVRSYSSGYGLNFAFSGLNAGQGNVFGRNNVGGVVGVLEGGSTVNECFSTMHIIASTVTTGHNGLGGIAGRMQWSNNVISNSYFHGAVKGGNRIGGLVGVNNDPPNSITNCYVVAQIDMNANEKGAFVGGGAIPNTLTNNFFSNAINSGLNAFFHATTPNPAGISGMTRAQMKTEATYSNANWAIPSIWQISNCTNAGYPYLTALSNTVFTDIWFAEFAIPDQCQGRLFELPLTSNDGIEGTWTSAYNPNQTETYTFVANSYECAYDTEVTITILPAQTSLTIEEACSSFNWNGNEYTQSGTYEVVFEGIAPNGCDSIAILQLTITNIAISVTEDDGILHASQSALNSYQWIDCETNQPIAGATSSSFQPLQSGEYAVLVSDGTCEVQSACVTYVIGGVDPVGINEFESISFNAFPNPMLHEVTIQSSTSVSALHGELRGTNGVLISTFEFSGNSITLSTEKLSSGVYFVSFSGLNTVIKLVK